jgi:hypothetical protein
MQLTHTEEFSGPWSIKTVDPGFLIRLTISGSDGSDGTFPGLGNPIDLVATGAGWRLTMEFAKILAAGGSSSPARIRRDVGFDLANGLVKMFSDVAGGLFEDDPGLLILRCQNLDPALNPFQGAVNPYDFTIDETMLRDEPPPPPTYYKESGA